MIDNINIPSDDEACICFILLEFTYRRDDCVFGIIFWRRLRGPHFCKMTILNVGYSTTCIKICSWLTSGVSVPHTHVSLFIYEIGSADLSVLLYGKTTVFIFAQFQCWYSYIIIFQHYVSISKVVCLNQLPDIYILIDLGLSNCNRYIPFDIKHGNKLVSVLCDSAVCKEDVNVSGKYFGCLYYFALFKLMQALSLCNAVLKPIDNLVACIIALLGMADSLVSCLLILYIGYSIMSLCIANRCHRVLFMLI